LAAEPANRQPDPLDDTPPKRLAFKPNRQESEALYLLFEHRVSPYWGRPLVAIEDRTAALGFESNAHAVAPLYATDPDRPATDGLYPGAADAHSVRLVEGLVFRAASRFTAVAPVVA
jgi:hypothetical protein